MSEAVKMETVDTRGTIPAERLALEVGILAGRLAELLRESLGPAEELGGAVAFLKARFEAVAGGRPLEAWERSALDRRPDGELHPLDRIALGLGLADAEVDLVLLAALPEEHEGLADLLRALHPEGRPYATAGLAAQLLCSGEAERGPAERRALRGLLVAGPAVAAGVCRLDGDGPFPVRSLKLADSLWPVFQGIDAWPAELRRRGGPAAAEGLEEWLAEPAVEQARRALAGFAACTVLVSADDEETALQRAAVLAEKAGVGAVSIELPPPPVPEQLISLHALARGIVPVLRLPSHDGPGAPQVPAFAGHPGPVVVCCREGAAAAQGSRPLLGVRCTRLRPSALERMWRRTLPRLAGDAPRLAACFPLEPGLALEVAADLDLLAATEERAVIFEDVAPSVRSRSGAGLRAGVRLIRPAAGWESLVLPEDRLRQLREAVDRLYHQTRVLDDWHFLEGRRGARGVRMLLSGPPGTGKTLSAEVLARALGVDLLLVDLARVVSKWIGETEKNLAEAFEAAERARAVLLFDEADALFGKRTEVSDAHDRYANLETAYLLARLERFEGLAILSTNLRQNIDDAFTRRLEFIVEYQEPRRRERLALWRCHLPDGAPLADDVSLEELAALYPMVGGMIKNAAVAAAFLAAAEDAVIGRIHFLRAIRREYEKTGKAFPGLPAGISEA